MTTDNLIEVRIWGKTLGALYLNAETGQTYFKFDSSFKNKEILFAPLTMPYPKEENPLFGPYFMDMSDPFMGLPPMIADSLPDTYGSKVIKEYLIANGHSENITPIRLLSYIGSRGMGALEFFPATEKKESGLIQTDLTELSFLSNQIIDDRKESFKMTKEELFKLFQFSTSAGGAKPKAILSYNQKENLYSYPYEHKEGYTPLIIKFDNTDANNDNNDTGRIEYLYYKMAKNCGINMNPCGFFKDGKNSHFYTVRFDRTSTGEKLHLQTLAAITGLNPKMLHNYDIVFDTILKLGLAHKELTQQFKVMVFNYYASNDDYHIKNISFIMDQKGNWSLSPAYDLTFPYDIANIWRKTQPLKINGKVKDIKLDDFLAVAKKYGVKKPKTIISTIQKELSQFSILAQKYDLPQSKADKIMDCFRFDK